MMILKKFNEWYEERRRQGFSSPPQDLTPMQREQIFLEDKTAMKKVLKEKIIEIEDNIRLWNNSIEKTYKELAKQTTDLQKAGYLGSLDFKQRELANEQKKLSSAKFKLQGLSSQSSTATLNVEKAKQFPIGDLISTKCVFSNETRAKYLCIFHNEKTASMVWDRKKNVVKCFGCGFYGSVIDVYMKIYDCDFKTALKILSN